MGVTTTLTYDDAGPSATGNLKGAVDSLGTTLAMTYDASGHVVSIDNGAAHQTFGYDANGRLTTTQDGLGATTTYSYQQTGCGCSEEDLLASLHTPDFPADKAWTFTYGAEGRLSTLTDPDGFAESYDYESTGELKQLIDRLGHVTNIGHDQLGRVASLVDPQGRTHARGFPVPSSGVFTGPAVVAGSASGVAATKDITAALNDGDYQVGRTSGRTWASRRRSTSTEMPRSS